MIFTLEALQAKHGDCLILHYGTNNNPKVLLIDGGPGTTYREILKPRLLEIKETLSDSQPLPLSMVMVSHIDDDHINGILALTNELVKQTDDNKPLVFDVQNFWFNAFDDVVGNSQIAAIAGVPAGASSASVSTASSPILKNLRRDVAAVIASTGQGRKLRDNVKALSGIVNNPFKPLKPGKANLVRGGVGQSDVDWDGLSIRVVHPNQQRLEELQTKWDKDVAKAKAGDTASLIATLGNKDKSPFNLSSIVCLVEFKKKKILLTGDARSDDILTGLTEEGILTGNKKLHVHILKVPHHGSSRNLTETFFKRVTADHYIVSADGKHDNPDQSLLDFFEESDLSGTIHFTNRDGEGGLKTRMDRFVKRLKTQGSNLTVSFRKPSEASMMIDLLDAVTY